MRTMRVLRGEVPSRRCTACGTEKPATRDYFYGTASGGLFAECKECVKRRRKKTYWANPDVERSKDRERSARPERREQLRASLRRQRAADPGKFNRRSREWAERNPEKRAAHVLLGSALKSGKVIKQACEGCGEPPSKAVHAHHDDYAKPLEVRWLCTRCHGEEHRAENEAKRLAERESTPAA